MKWVLLIVWATSGGVETQQIGFTSFDLCERAKAQISQQWHDASGICLQVTRNVP